MRRWIWPLEQCLLKVARIVPARTGILPHRLNRDAFFCLYLSLCVYLSTSFPPPSPLLSLSGSLAASLSRRTLLGGIAWRTPTRRWRTSTATRPRRSSPSTMDTEVPNTRPRRAAAPTVSHFPGPTLFFFRSAKVWLRLVDCAGDSAPVMPRKKWTAGFPAQIE